jgi:hypothetical protein
MITEEVIEDNFIDDSTLLFKITMNVLNLNSFMVT